MKSNQITAMCTMHSMRWPSRHHRVTGWFMAIGGGGAFPCNKHFIHIVTTCHYRHLHNHPTILPNHEPSKYPSKHKGIRLRQHLNNHPSRHPGKLKSMPFFFHQHIDNNPTLPSLHRIVPNTPNSCRRRGRQTKGKEKQKSSIHRRTDDEEAQEQRRQSYAFPRTV